MTSELSVALCAKYPQIFVNGNCIEAPDGWYDLIDRLCYQITFATECDDGGTDLPRALQVKSKFGGLRFYVEHCSPKISGIISMAESISYVLCETCGNKAKTRKESWHVTLCDHCYETHKQVKK